VARHNFSGLLAVERDDLGLTVVDLREERRHIELF
jgi:hypothetical protein